MKNLFEISPEEKNRIRGLHEGYKTVHGTMSLLTEQSDRKLKGVVKDAKTKEPIPFANIFVTENNTNGTTSDNEGKFELTGIKPGQTVTISFVGYTNNVVSDEIITSRQRSAVSDFLLEPGTRLGDVVVKAEREVVQGCMDPKAKNYNVKAWVDCKGTKHNIKYNVDDKTKEAEFVVNFDEIDKSCCEYYEGCHEEDAKNYYKNDKELVKLEKEGKKINACKKCCKKYSEGCTDPAALNYDENVEKGCKENKCCKYPKDERGITQTIQKNFEKYYIDRIIGSVINIYSNEKSRDERNIKKLLGNHKVNNEVPHPIRSGNGDWIGFAIPLQADTEAVKRVREKISTTRNPKKKAKLQAKLKQVESNNMEIAVRFGKNLKDILTFRNYKDGPEVYLRPKGSTKRGKRVYVGPREFNQIALAKRLVPFLQALNKKRNLVPSTDSNFDE